MQQNKLSNRKKNPSQQSFYIHFFYLKLVFRKLLMDDRLRPLKVKTCLEKKFKRYFFYNSFCSVKDSDLIYNSFFIREKKYLGSFF